MKILSNKEAANHKPVKHGGLFSVRSTSDGVIDFSSNVNPLGISPRVKRYLKKQMHTLSEYPDPDSKKLRKDLAWYTKLSQSQIVAGNGATEIIYNFCKAFLNRKTPVLIPIPTFGEYEAASKLSGCKIIFFKTMNLNEDIEQFIEKIPKQGCVFVCNPNNPTGILIHKKQMLRIICAAAKRSTFVFVDECFIEFVGTKESVANEVKKLNNLFVLRSLTKSFGLAGIRIGYGMANKLLISILNKIKIPWNVSGMAQKAASAALCYHGYLDKVRKLISKETRFLRNAISKIDGYSCYNTNSNFILIKSKIKSDTLQKKLLKKNILIRDCSTFRGLDKYHFRVAIKTHNENVKLVSALEAI